MSAAAWRLAQQAVQASGWVDANAQASPSAPWRDEAHWRVLDCGADWVWRLLWTWQLWRQDPRGPMALRYDVVCAEALGACPVGEADVPAEVWPQAQALGGLWPCVQQGECLPLNGGALRLQVHTHCTAAALAQRRASAHTVFA